MQNFALFRAVTHNFLHWLLWLWHAQYIWHNTWVPYFETFVFCVSGNFIRSFNKTHGCKTGCNALKATLVILISIPNNFSGCRHIFRRRNGSDTPPWFRQCKCQLNPFFLIRIFLSFLSRLFYFVLLWLVFGDCTHNCARRTYTPANVIS